MDAWLVPAVAFAAILYSSVGHGGASAYLALGTLAGISRDDLVPMALAMNIAVASMAAWGFRRYLKKRAFLSLIATSIPAAFLGARANLSSSTFAGLLGFALFFSGIRLLFFRKDERAATRAPRKAHWGYLSLAGLMIGLLSGMLGIGGGVFLSPIVLFLGWASVKETAALSSSFIVVNSLSGLTSYALRGELPHGEALPLAMAAVLGGSLGAHLGARKLSSTQLAPLLGSVLLMAAVKMWLMLV